MAILQCYSVFDKAVNAFMRPWYTVSRGEALRLFIDSVNDPASYSFKHPEDFILFQCGEFDDAKGIFTTEEPEKVLGASECRKLGNLELPGPGGS